jgi:hypothetical protein
MNENFMNNGSTSVEDADALTEQHPQVDNHQDENSTQNQSNSPKLINNINKPKKRPLNPTPLYISFFSLRSLEYINNIFIREYSCWSTHPSETAMGTFILFIILTIIVGVLTVCLTSPKPTGILVFFSSHKTHYKSNQITFQDL